MSKLSGVLWNLNSNSNSPVARRRLEQPDFCQSAQSRNERECKQTLKNMCQARVMIIISNNYIISTNQHFKSTFSIQIFEFQRHSCKRSFLFFFFSRLAQGAYSQASVKCGNNMRGFRKYCHTVKVIYMYCVIYQSH